MKAAMDIGTNSTRLLIVDGNQIIHQETTITRIGEGLKDSGRIQDEPLARTIQVLKKYQEVLISYNVKSSQIVATSAMRDALNREEVLSRIEAETGFTVDVISGQREAELSFIGAVSDFPGNNNVVIDIGGGSTEVIYEGRYTSTNLGGVRLKDNPDLRTEKKIIELFSENIESPTSLPPESNLIGVGGTITTIAAISLEMEKYDWEKIHGLTLSLEEIKKIQKKLKALPLEERKKIPGLQPERADIIIYGIIILLTFMEHYNFKTIKASDKDLLFALISQ